MAVAKREERLVDWPQISRWFDGLTWPEWKTEVQPIRIEEFREGTEHVIRAEIAGIDPDKDVDIDVQNGMLRIRAQREEKHEEKVKDGYRSEFQYGSFSRTLQLPPGATENDVKASYKDGILEIRVPVSQGRIEGTKVPIQRT